MAAPAQGRAGACFDSNIPGRLDRLRWSRWHLLVVIALGITWLLDGLEGNLAGSLAGILKRSDTLHMTDAQLGLSSTCYLIGSVLGALFFGYATDRLGRKKLFTVTLLLYLSATAATALSWNFWSFTILRALTGAGIGGEYAAVNSAVDELIPADVRGHVDLLINSTFWIGAAIGSGASLVLLNSEFLSARYSWRLAFLIGAALGSVVLWMRRHVPESPRWLMIHNRRLEAEAIVEAIEREATAGHPESLPPVQRTIKIQPRERTNFGEIWKAMVEQHRMRSILGFTLMVTQAFFYNAILFTYGLVLLRYYGVPAERLGIFLVPLALGNFVGPLTIGRLFDTIGRKPMIAFTYISSGVLLALTAWLFRMGVLTAFSQALCWSIIFFIASSAASSAYLTVSEVFPLEIRAIAISLFYACGTLVGGVGGPALYGYIVGTGSRDLLYWGYLAGAAVMVIGGVTEIFLGVNAERKSLEDIARPLACAD
ncbi:MAG: MFS transporter [Acidobacteriaceae bacterium]|nr:MFS transporter [Acidobacteriaceae bacterium]MBV8569252.1 MFS transporter [Acidobacteriaceae bacterium]